MKISCVWNWIVIGWGYIDWSAVSAIVAMLAVALSLYVSHKSDKRIIQQLNCDRANRNIDMAVQLYELDEAYVTSIYPENKAALIPKINSRAKVLKANGWKPDDIEDSAESYDYRSSLKNFINEQSQLLDSKAQRKERASEQKRIHNENKLKTSLV
ncbi:hypothetical protein BPY_09910 [Bifidobacterium psychraerophilum]|uniref:hypothetical protein n=1 Tax=Bifidobacterium psychraerophilum TaxID=218140 RepID=UPI003114B8B4